MIPLETATRALEIIRVIAPIHKHEIRRSVITVLPSVVRCALVEQGAGKIGVCGIFHGEREANLGWEMTEQTLVSGNLFDEFIVFEGCGANGGENCFKQFDLLFRVLGKLGRRKFKAFVDLLEAGHGKGGWKGREGRVARRHETFLDYTVIQFFPKAVYRVSKTLLSTKNAY